MSMIRKMNYIGPAFNDDGGEGQPSQEPQQQQPQQIKYEDIAGNRDLINQILQNSDEFKSVKSKADKYSQKLQEAQQKQQEMEEASQKGKLVNELMNGLFADVKDEATLRERLNEYAEIETSKAIETRDSKLKEYEEKLTAYEQKQQEFAKHTHFSNTVKEHKHVNPESHEFLYREIEQYMSVDEQGNVQYVDQNGNQLKGVDNKPITTAELIDDLVAQKPALKIFLNTPDSSGGFNGGSGGVKRVTQAEFNKMIFNASDAEEQEILRKRRSREIEIVD